MMNGAALRSAPARPRGLTGLFRSASVRLAALYTAIFALSVAVLGVTLLMATRSALSEQFDFRVRAEVAALL